MIARLGRALLAFALAQVAIATLTPPALAAPPPGKGDRIGSLTAAGKTYRDVEILLIDDKNMYIRHKDGSATIPLSDLDARGEPPATYRPPLPPAIEHSVVLRTVADTIPQAISDTLPHGMTAPLPNRAAVLRFVAAFMLVILAVALVIWVAASYCCLLICRKAGHEPGLLIWIPVLQSIPLLRAAGMSPAFWLLTAWVGLPVMAFWTALLAPGAAGVVALGSLVFNLAYIVTWSLGITRARGKSGIWALLLCLPVTNLIAFLYLAFSE